MFSREKRLLKKLASADANFKTALARDATAPAAVLGSLAQDGLVDIRRTVAENASTGTETLFLLSHDADRGVRDKALGRLLELSGNAKASRVVRDSAASPRLIASIAEDLSWSDVRELCGNGYDWDDRHGEFPEPSTPLLAELVRVRNARVREELAKSKHATPVILASLARDADEGVRFAVASNASTPPQTLAMLLIDPAVRVRKQTLTNANLPTDALSAVVADENAEVRQQLAATTSASFGTLNQLANDESAGVRCAVARNPASPDRLLDRLSVDPEKEVRLAVALAAAPVMLFGAMTTMKNYERATPLEALSNLSADADAEVRKAAASHPGLPLEAFHRLANDPDEGVRNHAAAVIEHGYRYPRPEQSYSTYGQEKEPSDFPTSALPALAASPHDAIRKAVARHPLIPARLLAQLLDDGRVFDQDFSDRDKPWSSRTLMPFAVLNDLSWDTTEEWMTLAQVANPQARQTLAFSARTPSAVLTLLAADEVEYVREGLLENHQLPTAALRKLVDDPSPAVAKKAASLLANHTWRFRDDLGVFLDANNEGARATLARDESARPEWLDSLSQDPAALVRAAVAGNSNTSPRVLESLSTDADLAVSSAIEGAVKGSALSLESLEAVAASPHPPIRAAVAGKPGLTDETLRTLVSDADESVRLAAARNGYTYGAALMDAMGMEELNRTHGIGQRSVVSLCTLAADTTLGSDPLHALAQSPFEQVRETVAKNPSTSVPTLANLARDKSPQVREAVASHAGTPLGSLTTLASDEAAAVRGAVASNPATPAETLVLLEREPDEKVALAVALHPNTAPSSLGALVEVHAEPRLSSSNSRALSKLGPDVPVFDVLAPWRRQLRDQLARSDNRWHQGVRQAVASNPSVSPEVLLRLSRQPDTVVFVARNPSAPNTVLSHLVRHSDTLVREALAAHSQMPEADLATLALDESEAVRRVVAANQHTPTSSLEILASDFSPQVREVAQSTLSLRS